MSAQSLDPEIVYLTLADVIALHEAVILRTSASFAPMRDEGLLESALARPRMASFYEGADVVRQAALLAVAISQAQAFVDGNKRTAYVCADAFLDMNGLEIISAPLELATQLEAVASRLDDLDSATQRFETWLRRNVKKQAT